VALAGMGALLWQRHIAGEEAARADTVKEFVLSIIAQADPTASRDTRDADLTLLTTAESRLARELGPNPALALELRLAIAQAYRNRGEYERTRSTLRSAIDEARKTLPPDDLNLMRAWVRMADWQVIDDDEVMRELDATIDRARKLGRRGAQILVEGLTARAGLRQQRQALFDQGRADFREAHEVAVRYFGPGDPIALGVAIEMRERGFSVSESLPVIEAAYRSANATPDLDPAHPKRIHVQSIYGTLLCLTGRGREGLELLRASVLTARKHHGTSLPTEYALTTLRVGLLVTGDVRGSLAAARETLALASAREAPGARNRAIRTQGFIEAAIAGRNVDEASLLNSELEARNAKSAESRRRDFVTVILIGNKMWLMNLAGDTVGAERIAEQTVAKAEALGQRYFVRRIRLAWSYALRRNAKALEAERVLADMGDARPDDFDEQDFLSESAAVRLAVGKAQGALELADRALAAFQRIRLQVDPALADLHVTRGQALLALNRPEEARDALQIADNFWRDYDAGSHWAAEATYWLARALIETGDRAAGQRMLKSAQARLANSPMASHRALAGAGA
jgi:tetratricopeptide (TPR) repeat protein